MIVSGNSNDEIGRAIGAWFSEKTGKPMWAPFASIGWIRNNCIVAAAVFCEFTGPNVDVHVYGPGEFRRTQARQIADYVFNHLKCRRLTAKVPRRGPLVDLLPRLGFFQEAVLEGFYGESPDGDAILFRLTPDSAVEWMKK